jgi:hypothetical protein
MAAITTRQTAGTGATVKNAPLTNAEVDNNFIALNTDLSNAVYLTGTQTISGPKTFSNNVNVQGPSGGALLLAYNTTSSSSTAIGVRPRQNFTSFDGTKTISATMLDSGQLSWSGSAGQLFSITDSLTGTLFSVNDVSGIPSIEVLDTGLVKIAQYNGNVVVGSGVDNAVDKVQVVGTTSIVANSSSAALRVTQTGTGDALRVEDSANPDSTPFVITNDGKIGIGLSTIGSAKSGVIHLSNLTSEFRIESTDNTTGTANSLINLKGFAARDRSIYFTDTSDTEVAAIGLLYNGGSPCTALSIKTAGLERVRITSEGNVGILGSLVTFTNTNLRINKPITGSVNSNQVFVNGQIQSDVTGTSTYFRTQANQASGFTNTTLVHYTADQGTLSGTVTNQIGFSAESSLVNGTNNFGFYSNISSGTNRWNFFANGTAPNYFAGNVSIGAGAGSFETLFVRQTSAFYTAVFENSSTDGVARGVSIRATANNIPTLNISRWYSTFAGNADVGQIRFDGLGTTSSYVEHAGIYAAATGANTATGAPTKLSFKTSDGTTSTEKMAISATGVVSIAATTVSTTTTTGALVVGGGVGIAGALNATTKSFIIDHPTKSGKLLKHGSLEGPEFGVYLRGRLDNNNMIVLPEYWTKLVDPATITVHLTPVGSHQELYVEDIANNVVFVKNNNLFNKTINCFYTVFGERADVDKLEVEVD